MTIIYPTLPLLARPEVTPSALAVTRTSAARRVNALGRVETVAANVLRHDYAPDTGAYRGWLVEEARSNLFLYTETLTDALWKTDAASVAAGAVTAPEETGTAFTLTENAATAIHTLYQEDLSFTASQDYALSVFAKSNGRERLQIVLPSTAFGAVQSAVFNLVAGTIDATEGSAVPVLEALADGWYRCAITATAASTTPLAPVHFRLRDTTGFSTYDGDGSSGVHLWGPQLEAGSGATSYIATTSAPANRPADQVNLSLGAWPFNPFEGTVLVRGAVPGGQSATLASLHDGTSDNRLSVTLDTAGGGSASVTVVAGGATVASLTDSGVTGGAEARCAAAFAADDFALVLNGSAEVTDTGGAVPSGLTTLTLGGTADGTVGPRCWIRQVGVFPRRLSEADLQTITV
ncbi:hypothetical protein [uncultured Rhodospira sp.]|uniref:phage head spike fiber domain-containing protein n=1 Tax=uncultured Rhodospira sp. TaxID=1936189 RepID=UPI002628BDED|nr:hypothetical protein [uncultured Rhodospira sp.]